MASVDYQKLHGSEGAMILGHDARWDGREDVKYKNEHVNPEMTHLNSVVFANESYQNETSKQAYERLKNRVQEIDEIEPPQRIRKDRVTMIGVEIPCPPNVDEEKFFKMAMEEVVKVLCDNDSRNASNMYVHRDEIHDYVDCVSKQMRTSLTHGHCVVVPHVDGKGVNGKSWATKKRFIQMNKAIDERCRKEFGVPFLTGTREKSKATVEQLKTESIKAAEELEQQKQKELSDIQKEIDKGQIAKEQVKPYIVADDYEPKTKKNILGQNVISNEELFKLMKRSTFVKASEYALETLEQSKEIISNKDTIIDNAKRDATRYRQKGKKVLDDANKQSEQIINEAEEQANQIIQDAQREANSRWLDDNPLEQEIKDLQKELSGYENVIIAIQSYFGDKWNDFWNKVLEHWKREKDTKNYDKDVPDR